MTRLRAWARGHRKLVLASALAASSVVLANALAWRHARAFLHYTDGGPRTEKPEKLSAGEKLSALLLGINVPKPVNRGTPADLGLAFTTERFPSRDGLELEAWRVPCEASRGLVVLFHGYAASKSQELPAARFLHDQGYETFLVDFRGSGGSAGNETTLGVREAGDVASATSRAVASSPHKEPILLGTSMGGAAVLRAIREEGVRPKAVVLEAPFGRMLDAVRSRFAQMHVPSFPLAWLLVFWGGFQEGFDGFAHNPVEYASSVTCPALLLHGEADPTVSLEQAREILAALAGPKHLETFPGVGHEHLLAASPEAWKAAVSSFLR